MAKPRDDRQKDLLRPALEPVIELGHPLARLPQRIDRGFLDGRFSRVCTAGAGRPPLPAQLVAGHPPRPHSPRHCWFIGAIAHQERSRLIAILSMRIQRAW
jgi:hypothetical protein